MKAARKPSKPCWPDPVSSPVQIQDFQAFECTSCGRCCKPWEIALEAVQTAAIRQSEAYMSRVKEGYVPLIEVRGGVGELGDRGDDQCTFLNRDNLCELHAEIGGRLKPMGCQLYPYQAVQTPDGMFAYLSFACPPAVTGQDCDVESNRSQLDEVLSKYSDPLPDSSEEPFVVDLSGDLAISWASYLQLEERLLSAYRREQPLESILEMLLDVFQVASRPFGGWPPLATPGADLGFAKEICAKLLGSLVSSVEKTDDEGERVAMARTFGEGLSVRSTRFGITLPPLDLDCSYPGWMLDTYHRYFRNAILGKALLKSTVTGKLLALAAAVVLSDVYAQGYARARGLDEVDMEALIDGFRVVENDILTHNPVATEFFAAWEETFRAISDFHRITAG